MSSENAPAVELRNVSLSYGATPVLDGISLTVAPQERLVIVGQSGAGKTTLLRLILGLIRPTSGAIWLEGREISSLGKDELRQIRTGIGMVFEEAALLSSISVEDNLALPLEELTAASEDEIDHVVAEKLALVGLAGENDTLPSALSGGMRKRVGLARALVRNPRLILLDEPTAGLDPVTSAVIEKLVINLTERTHVTSIITTPVIRTSLRLATRIVMLHAGKLIPVGSPAEFMHSRHPAVAGYIAAATSTAHRRAA